MPKPRLRFWHVRVRASRKKVQTRVMSLGDGILATRQLLAGKWKTQKLMFPKAGYSRAQAQAWVKAHEGETIMARKPKRTKLEKEFRAAQAAGWKAGRKFKRAKRKQQAIERGFF